MLHMYFHFYETMLNFSHPVSGLDFQLVVNRRAGAISLMTFYGHKLSAWSWHGGAAC